MTDKTAIRPAATIVLWRSRPDGQPEILMGQRGAAAAFMPSKYVFPGGAVDPADKNIVLAAPLPAVCESRLKIDALDDPQALAAAAIRELWEETGLALGLAQAWTSPPPADVGHDWDGFAKRGVSPSAAGLNFIFRAITPPGRPRRFDARFFLVHVDHIVGDVTDFSRASDELSHLHWIALSEVRSLDVPFITEVVLAEVAAFLRDGPTDAGVPFFDNSGPVPTFRRLA